MRYLIVCDEIAMRYLIQSDEIGMRYPILSDEIKTLATPARQSSLSLTADCFPC